jgi:hypothetical protein
MVGVCGRTKLLTLNLIRVDDPKVFVFPMTSQSNYDPAPMDTPDTSPHSCCCHKLQSQWPACITTLAFF